MEEKQCPYCAEKIKAEAIRCRHCQADLLAATKTTKKKSGLAGKVFLWIVITPIVAIGGLMVVGSMLDNTSQHRGETSSSFPKADQQIWLNSSAFGCLSISDLDRALDHYTRSEYTAWAEITGSKYCFHQDDVSPIFSWTVIQIRGDRMQIGIKRASEYQKNPDMAKYDYWTLTKWALPNAPPNVATEPTSVDATRVALKIGSKSKPATFSAPVRASADPSKEIIRGVKIGSIVQVYQLERGMVRISKSGQPAEWIVPEMLEW